jgi:penicillin-binding protein 1A
VSLADKPPIPFSVPPGIKLIRVEAKSGMRAGPGDNKVILEAFKPGTAPPDTYSVIGADSGVPTAGSPDSGSVVRTGTGGLY